MKGFICPHCKGSIQIPNAAQRLEVAREMAEEGMPLREAERLCGLAHGTIRHSRLRSGEKTGENSPPPPLEIVDWRNGKPTKEHEFERQVETLLNQGLTQTEIGRRLGGSKSGQSPRVAKAIGRIEGRRQAIR